MADHVQMFDGFGYEIGDRVLCKNGHHVATADTRLGVGDFIGTWASCFDYEIQRPKIGTPFEGCVCPHCGTKWIGKP